MTKKKNIGNLGFTTSLQDRRPGPRDQTVDQVPGGLSGGLWSSWLHHLHLQDWELTVLCKLWQSVIFFLRVIFFLQVIFRDRPLLFPNQHLSLLSCQYFPLFTCQYLPLLFCQHLPLPPHHHLPLFPHQHLPLLPHHSLPTHRRPPLLLRLTPAEFPEPLDKPARKLESSSL